MTAKNVAMNMTMTLIGTIVVVINWLEAVEEKTHKVYVYFQPKLEAD